MSGATVGGVIGGAIGFWVGGPAGAQWGWMIGSAIGGYVDPEVITGPRLQDARVQTSRDGVAIPFGWGTFPVAGNIIWQQADVTEHRHEDRQGKGGPVVESFTYSRSYAIGICRGEVGGILIARKNGKTVFDARDDATLQAEYEAAGLSAGDATARISEQRSQNARFLSNFTLYLGDETQEPDPTIEAHLGVGNVPAYRGLCYAVVEDDDVTELQGAIPQFEFVMAACGSTTLAPVEYTWMGAVIGDASAGHLAVSPDGYDWSALPGGVSVEGGGAWSPSGSGHMYEHGGQVLGLSGAAGSFGSHANAFRDTDGLWYPVTMPAGSGSLKIIHTGTTWMVARHAGGGIAYSTNPRTTAFVDCGVEAESICLCGGGVLRAYATGTSFDIVVFSILNSVGDVVSSPPDLHVGYLARQATIERGSSTIGMALVERFGTGNVDRRVHVLTSTDNATTWVDHGSPLPDFLAPGGDPRVLLHYSRGAGMWALCAFDRVAVGTSLASLTLLPAFSDEVRGVSDDGFKFVFGCADGAVYTYTAGLGLLSSTSGATGVFMDVVAFGVPQNAVPIPDGGNFFVDPDGVVYGSDYYTVSTCQVPLSEIVSELCEMEGLTADEIDVADLAGINVRGFRIANEGDAASAIAALQAAYFFDVGEWDGKIRFVLRGGEAVASINGDDLVERDGGPFERERIQEAELLRRVTVGYIDPSAGFAPTTQKWERRAGTVRAMGEASVELPLTLTADEAATIAKKRGLTAWGEPESQKFSLPYKYAALTPTDVVNYTDEDGEVYTIRLMGIEDDGGIREIESADNCAEAYGATATGVAAKPPMVTNTNVRGPSVLRAMNLDSLRPQDNVPGMYVAACGIMSGWPGCLVQLSTDLGVTFRDVATITTPATMGFLTTDNDTSSEPIGVQLYQGGSLSSVTSVQISDGMNAAAIVSEDVAELVQFETATATGTSTYDLTDVTRGVNDTTPAAHIYGDSFVLLDSAVVFVPINQALAGATLIFRAVTLGTSSDSAASIAVVYEPPSFVIDGGGP